MRLIATILIVGGILALIYGGFTYTKDEKKADLGPIELRVRERERIELPPLIGGIALGTGLALLAVSMRRGRRLAA